LNKKHRCAGNAYRAFKHIKQNSTAMKTHLFFLIATLLLISGLSAQPNKKLAPALGKFLNTEFMIKFHDLKLEAESAAMTVIAKEQKMKPEDVAKVRTAFNQTAQRANKILEGIKQDFLDPKKLKSIEAMPDLYSDGLKLRLIELQEFYSMHFQQTLADATADQVDGSALLLIVTELINLTRGLTVYFAQMQREARMYTEDYLNQHLVKPHRWRYWNEVQAGEGNGDHYTDYIQYHDIQTTNPNATNGFPATDLNNLNNSWNSTNNANNNSWNNTTNNTGTDWNNTNNANNTGTWNNTTTNNTGTNPGTTTDPWNTTPPATTPAPLPGDTITTMPPVDSTSNLAKDPFKYDGGGQKGAKPTLPADKQPVKNQPGAVPPKAKVNTPVPIKNNN
jgi:hypothetical protein